MASERLSRLQKWILLFLYDEKRKDKTGISYIESQDIYRDFYGIIHDFWHRHYNLSVLKKTQNARPVVCTCFRRMKEKGLLKEGDYRWNCPGKIINFEYENKIYVLTDKGKEIAKNLKINLSNVGEIKDKKNLKINICNVANINIKKNPLPSGGGKGDVTCYLDL